MAPLHSRPQRRGDDRTLYLFSEPHDELRDLPDVDHVLGVILASVDDLRAPCHLSTANVDAKANRTNGRTLNIIPTRLHQEGWGEKFSTISCDDRASRPGQEQLCARSVLGISRHKISNSPTKSTPCRNLAVASTAHLRAILLLLYLESLLLLHHLLVRNEIPLTGLRQSRIRLLDSDKLLHLLLHRRDTSAAQAEQRQTRKARVIDSPKMRFVFLLIPYLFVYFFGGGLQLSVLSSLDVSVSSAFLWRT